MLMLFCFLLWFFPLGECSYSLSLGCFFFASFQYSAFSQRTSLSFSSFLYFWKPMSWGSDSVGQVLVWYTQITEFKPEHHMKQPCWYPPANPALSQERQEDQLHRGFKTSLGCTGSCLNPLCPPKFFKLLSFTFYSCTSPLYIIAFILLKALRSIPKLRLQALHHVLKALVSSENNMLRFWLINF